MHAVRFFFEETRIRVIDMRWIVLSAFGGSTHRERQCALRRSLLLLLLLCWAPNGSTGSVTSPAQGLSGMCEGGESCELRMRAGTRPRGLQRRITGTITGCCEALARRQCPCESERPVARTSGKCESGRGTRNADVSGGAPQDGRHLKRVSGCQVNARAGEGEREGGREKENSQERGARREWLLRTPSGRGEKGDTEKAALRAARMGFSVSLRVTGPFHGTHEPPEC